MQEKLESRHEIILDHLSKVSLQSMTDTCTNDVEASLLQVRELLAVGCEKIRVSVPSIKEVQAFVQIAEEIRQTHPNVYLIGDVHYDSKVAIAISPFADKVRINPGNFLSRQDLHLLHEERALILKDKLTDLVKSCKTYNTSIRIGVNQGSIYRGDRPTDSPIELVEILLEYVNVFRQLDFHDLVLSIKSSNAWTMIEANQILDENLKLRNWHYPIHLGVTEAGKAWSGRLNSALGIGTCLLHGIGNTMRVSLTENPTHEIESALCIKKALRHISGMDWEMALQCKRPESSFTKPIILHKLDQGLSDHSDWQGDYTFNLNEKSPLEYNEVSLCNLSALSEKEDDLPKLLKLPKDEEGIYIAGILLPHLLKNHAIDGLLITSLNEKELDRNMEVASDIFHLSGKRNLRSSVISCPGCSRTNFELENLVDEIRNIFSSLKITFSVMGCAVNGYGEMMKADIGILGSSKNKVDVYQKQDLLKAAISMEEVIPFLKSILNHKS